MRAPWRERLMTALLVVVVAVPVGIVIGGGLDFGGADEEVLDVADGSVPSSTTTTTARPTTTTVAPTTTTVAARPAAEVRVRFYNGSRTAGAAVTVGRRLEALGYDVLSPGPSPSEPLTVTVVAHREGFAVEAAAIARDLGLPALAATPFPPVPTVAGVGDADVVVIVADDAVAAAEPAAASPPPG